MTKEGFSKVTEKTLVPISLVVVLITVVIYVAQALANVVGLEKRVSTVEIAREKDRDEYTRNLIEISTRLSRIEGAVGVKSR